MISTYRIGQGFDRHRLVENRPLILGGVKIPHHKGLDGHSDADVLLHAITDALLGALALGDIGEQFPDTDPQFKGADSAVLLRLVMQLILQRGWRVVNADCTVFAQQPKLSAYKPEIQARVAELLCIGPPQVSIKAKTGERVGATGREEAIDASAIVLLQQHQEESASGAG